MSIDVLTHLTVCGSHSFWSTFQHLKGSAYLENLEVLNAIGFYLTPMDNIECKL